MRECFSDYADNYEEYKSFIYYYFDKRPPMDGFEAQMEGICFIREEDVTERERFIMILSVIVWEIEHDMLTEELTGELEYYYYEWESGRLKQHIRKDDLLAMRRDLLVSYKKVFG